MNWGRKFGAIVFLALAGCVHLGAAFLWASYPALSIGLISVTLYFAFIAGFLWP